MPRFFPPRHGGYTLIELLTTVALLGILAALTAPSLRQFVVHARVDSALSGLAGDLYYARVLAVKSGRRVRVEFSPQARDECIRRYRLQVESDPPRFAKSVQLSGSAAGVCLTMNNANPLVFTSRGLLHGVGSRTFTARRGSVTGCLSLAQLGRVRRSC